MTYLEYIDLKIEELRVMEKLFTVYAPVNFKPMGSEVGRSITRMLENLKYRVENDNRPDPF